MRPGSPAPAFGRILGGLLVLGGLWHASAPWVLGYADVGRAAASDVASGLAVALLGAVRAAGVRAWPIAASAAVGGWILIAPLALGYTGVGAAANQALWSAAGVSAVAALAVLGWRANRADARLRPGPAPERLVLPPPPVRGRRFLPVNQGVESSLMVRDGVTTARPGSRSKRPGLEAVRSSRSTSR